MFRNKLVVAIGVIALMCMFSVRGGAFDMSQAYDFKCDIYYDSQYGEGINKTMGSFLSIRYDVREKCLKCVQHINDTIENTYKIDNFLIKEDYASYVLKNFFGQYDGQMTLVVSPEMNDIVVVSVNCKEDTTKTHEMLLLDSKATPVVR